MDIKMEESFLNLINSYFNQDTESLEEGIEEILNEEQESFLRYAVEFITEFLNWNISDTEKVNFIHEKTELYFDEDIEECMAFIEEILNRIKMKLG